MKQNNRTVLRKSSILCPRYGILRRGQIFQKSQKFRGPFSPASRRHPKFSLCPRGLERKLWMSPLRGGPAGAALRATLLFIPLLFPLPVLSCSLRACTVTKCWLVDPRGPRVPERREPRNPRCELRELQPFERRCAAFPKRRMLI